MPSGDPREGVERLGLFFPLVLVWLFFEFGRPPQPFKIPLLISVVLFFHWVATRDKQLGRQGPWWFGLLAVMAVMVPFATNNYDAFWTTRNMAVLVLCVCLPMQALLTSVRRIRWWVLTFLGIAFYVGAWAATHGGYGPSGADGGQDENYVAALMCMAIPFAYFSLFYEKRRVQRLVLIGLMLVFVAAIALGENPSRGGFLGLCVTALYCVARSPRKRLGFGILGLLVVAMLLIAGPAFWSEIRTTTDYQSGTGDMRLEIWKAGWRMWQANPILGVGPGNFKWEIGNFQSAEQYAKFDRSLAGAVVAHSLQVELLAELGLAGVLATGMLVLRTWRGLGQVRDSLPLAGEQRGSERLELRCYSDAIRASILAILVNGIFLSLLYFAHLWLLIALGAAIPFVARRLGAPDARMSQTKRAEPPRGLAGAVPSAGMRAPGSLERPAHLGRLP